MTLSDNSHIYNTCSRKRLISSGSEKPGELNVSIRFE